MHEPTVDPLAPPSGPGEEVVVFAARRKHLRVAVCPACWWSTPGEVAPQVAVIARREHEQRCPGAPPAGVLAERIAAAQYLYRRHVQARA